jgi:hypothetical protein
VGVKRLKRRAGPPRENRPQARGLLRDAQRFPRNHGSEGEAVEYGQLGRSGLRISAMTLGTMGFGGGGVFGNVGTGDAQDARRQIDLALEAGVNLIDTADVHSMGETEEIVGQALGSGRDDVIPATKARFPMGDGANEAGSSRHHPVRACEASMRRLGTDDVDLYQPHERDGQTPLEETLTALEHPPSGKCASKYPVTSRRPRAPSTPPTGTSRPSTTRTSSATPSIRSSRPLKSTV